MVWPVEFTELSPFSRVRRLQQEMNRLFDGAAYAQEPFPALNVWSDGEKAELSAEIPGADPKELHISILGDKVSIEGELKAEKPEEGAIWQRRERPSGKFSRTVRLPFEIEASKVVAKSANGTLRLTLPRAEASKPRKIAVSAE